MIVCAASDLSVMKWPGSKSREEKESGGRVLGLSITKKGGQRASEQLASQLMRWFNEWSVCCATGDATGSRSILSVCSALCNAVVPPYDW